MVWWRDDRGPFKVVSTIYKWHELMNSGGSRPSYKGGGGGSHPDLQIREGGVVIQTLRWGGGGLKKIFFDPSGLSLV